MSSPATAINITIPSALKERVKDVIRRKGFVDQSELLHYALLRYLDEIEESKLAISASSREDRIAALSDSLAQALHASIGGKKLPSARKQLARLKDI